MPAQYTFPKSRRLGGRGTFKFIRDNGVRESRGPLTLWAIPNDNKHLRLGISIGRPVGTAVQRNRIKRLLRESFRLMQHDWPFGYDLVITVRRHEPMILAEYQKLLMAMIVIVHGKLQLQK
ncbi:MAG TPA: ribonuclease P protein component [Tepidisphaeraceae bacterium]|nr:ribonuclease P protein component [Tepidisphaeraceae bacterium]